MKMRRFLYCTIFLLTAGRAHAQGGPPVLTDDPWTPRPNHWEINAGWTVEKRPGFSSQELPIADLNYGWGTRVQVKLEVPFVVQSADYVAHSAVGNALAGVKWRFIDDVAGFGVSTYPQLQIPRSHKAERSIGASAGWGLLVPLEIAHAIGSFDVDAEIGRWVAPRAERFDIAGLALGYEPRQGLEFVVECNEEGERLTSPASVVCGGGVRADLTEHAALMGALEPSVRGHDTERPRLRSYVGVQAHVRGGGLFKHRRHHTG